jgi:hypothetical protein
MAEHGATYHHGDQDASEQRATFHLVLFATKWFTLYLAAFLVLATLWFCTSAGFVSGFISAVALIAVGTFFLRSKPKTH